MKYRFSGCKSCCREILHLYVFFFLFPSVPTVGSRSVYISFGTWWACRKHRTAGS